MKIERFENSEILEDKLTQQIIKKLQEAIDLFGKAQLLVSGGSTPVKLFQKLSKIDISWENVRIGLIDERFVPNNNEFSNELLAKTHLLQNFAEKAEFLGMVYNSQNESENLKLAQENYQKFNEFPLSISILGMGDDGHTASLFPNDPNSENDLKGNFEKNLISTNAPNFPNKRITINKNFILSSENIYLMLIGESKLEVLNQVSEKKLPMSYFIENKKLTIFYSEKK